MTTILDHTDLAAAYDALLTENNQAFFKRKLREFKDRKFFLVIDEVRIDSPELTIVDAIIMQDWLTTTTQGNVEILEITL